MLDANLVLNLNARAADEYARTDAAGLHQVMANVTTVQMKGLFGMLAMAIGRPLGGGAAPVPPPPPPLAAPASRRKIESAEKRLGRKLPDDLRSLYLHVADGGFGPSDGILSIDAAIAQYKELCAEPQGPNGEAWPAALLPLVMWDAGCDAYDLGSGIIIRWDPEVLVEEPAKIAFKKSFKGAAKTLGAYLQDWLDKSEKKSAQPVDPAVDKGKLFHLKNCLSSMGERQAARKALARWDIALGDEPVDEAWCKALGLDPAIYLPALKSVSA